MHCKIVIQASLKIYGSVFTFKMFQDYICFSQKTATCVNNDTDTATVSLFNLFQPHAPVVSKAAFLMELCYFVHSCNKGQWPVWMKLNFPMFRPSGPLPPRGAPNGQKRTHILQQAAGKMFYQWGEVIETNNLNFKYNFCTGGLGD